MTHFNIVICTGSTRFLQPQVIDGESDPAALWHDQLPATHPAVRVQVGVIGGGDGS